MRMSGVSCDPDVLGGTRKQNVGKSLERLGTYRGYTGVSDGQRIIHRILLVLL